VEVKGDGIKVVEEEEEEEEEEGKLTSG